MRRIVRLWVLATLVMLLFYLPLLQWLLSGSSGGVYSTDYGSIAPPPSSITRLRYSPHMTNKKHTPSIIKYKQQRNYYTINRNPIATLAPTNTTMTSSWPPNNTQIYLIHVGKTGGSTIVKALQLSNYSTSVKCMVRRTTNNNTTATTTTTTTTKMNKCYKQHPSNATTSQLTQSIMGVYHTWSPLLNRGDKYWLLHNTNVFLFTIRNPISRLQSAYNYHKDGSHTIIKLSGKRNTYKDVKQYFYTHCYSDGFNTMITKLRTGVGKSTNTNTTSSTTTTATTTTTTDDDDMENDCYTIGRNVLLGKSYQGDIHFQYNYEYYYNYTMNQYNEHTHALAVVRAEYLWEDVIQLDEQIGGGSSSSSSNYWNTMKGFKVTHGSENYTTHQDMISIPNSIYLCCLLYNEIEIYQLLLLKARNLSNEQKRMSMNELLSSCHVKNKDDDVLSNPFSWMDYHKGKICQGQ